MIEKIRKAIREENYRISSHANEEMADDDLLIADIEQVILTGKIYRKLTRDPRGTRYEIHGLTVDGRKGAVVCRFIISSKVLIITAYVL